MRLDRFSYRLATDDDSFRRVLAETCEAISVMPIREIIAGDGLDALLDGFIGSYHDIITEPGLAASDSQVRRIFWSAARHELGTVENNIFGCPRYQSLAWIGDYLDGQDDNSGSSGIATLYYFPDVESRLIVKALMQQEDISTRLKFQRLDEVPSDHLLISTDPAIRDDSIYLWGDGRKHHHSLYVAPPYPYDKAVFDKHRDFTWPFYADLVDLDTSFFAVHNSVAAHYDGYINEIAIFLGNREDEIYQVQSCNQPGKVRVQIKRLGGSWIHDSLPLHCSADLDIVRGFPARPEHQSKLGEGVDFEELYSELTGLFRDNHVTRFDLGGLYIPPYAYVYDGEVNPLKDQSVLEFGIECHARLISAYLDSR